MINILLLNNYIIKKIKLVPGTNTFDLLINGLCKGFIFDNINVENIKKLQLIINNKKETGERNFNNSILKLYSTKFNNCFYFGIDSKPFDNFDLALDLTSYIKKKITLNIEVNGNYNITIYAVCGNLILYKDGICNLLYN